MTPADQKKAAESLRMALELKNSAAFQHFRVTAILAQWEEADLKSKDLSLTKDERHDWTVRYHELNRIRLWVDEQISVMERALGGK